MNVADIEEPPSEELDEEVGAPSGADSEGGPVESLEGEPALADE